MGIRQNQSFKIQAMDKAKTRYPFCFSSHCYDDTVTFKGNQKFSVTFH